MKKLLVLMLVLGIASAANASLLISVDGVVDPPDSEVILMPSDTVVIDIFGDGQTPRQYFYMGILVDGPGSLDISNAVMLYPGTDSTIVEESDPYIAGYLGIGMPYALITMQDAPPPGDPLRDLEGTLVDGILFHCDAVGEVTIILTNQDGVVLDTQVIHQIPEPMTIALLGLGGLLLRRRK